VEPENLGITPPPAPSLGQQASAANEEGAPDDGATSVPVCPRCQAKLINPASLGLCPGCGYCRLLEEGKEKDKEKAKKPKKRRRISLLGLVEFCELLAHIPAWFCILLIGLGTIVYLSYRADAYLAPQSPARTWWSMTQLILGIMLFLGAQLWALALVAPYEERLGLVFSTRLWRATFRRLPETRWPVWLLCWSLAAIVLDLAVIGGLSEEISAASARFRKEVEKTKVQVADKGPSSEAAKNEEMDQGGLPVWTNLTLGSVSGAAGWLAASLPGFEGSRPQPPSSP
jgi:hypothetical protein